MSRQQSQLQNEMEIVKSIRKLTPEERRKECRREMFRELREMEMERRRAALEGLQTCRREKEERDKETERLNRQKERIEEERRQEAKQRDESRANEQKALEKQKQDQLKKERLHWKKVMMVEEEPNTGPRFTLSDLKKEQQWRSDEAELCRLRKVDNEASFKCLTSELKGQEQSKRKTLCNNWVGEQSTDSETDDEKLPPNGSTHTPSTEKASPDFEATPKSTESLLSLQKKQSFGLCFEKYWDQVERRRRREARRLKAEERYAKWAAFKERRQRLLSEQVH
ncbi:myosin-M heavy chain-like [Siniperca chuatsi]|uniref:myosin-M heavy chain-like n=1 Tax=Siniperca chuatsi TaxID=119488 RepID=UPI001CE0C8E6|nr:myosin-M heavy chain-like [Siniperca chuatsi]